MAGPGGRQKIQAALKRGRAGKGYGSNPGGFIRMGKLVEIRYYRDHGSFKGFYKHPFQSPARHLLPGFGQFYFHQRVTHALHRVDNHRPL